MAFALHGHATILYGLELDDVVTAGYEYAFVSFPESVKDTNYSQLWCIAFYFLLSMLAFNGVVAFLVAGLSAFEDSFVTLRRRRKSFVLATCTTLFLLSLPAATGGGVYVIKLIDAAVNLNMMPWIALAEVILIIYGYGISRLTADIRFMTGHPPDIYLTVCWRFICPVALVFSVVRLVSTSKSRIDESKYNTVSAL
ncbi:sodium-dependent noradrenaline transporter-like [Amblyomma americanum]